MPSEEEIAIPEEVQAEGLLEQRILEHINGDVVKDTLITSGYTKEEAEEITKEIVKIIKDSNIKDCLGYINEKVTRLDTLNEQIKKDKEIATHLEAKQQDQREIEKNTKKAEHLVKVLEQLEKQEISQNITFNVREYVKYLKEHPGEDPETIERAFDQIAH